MSTPRLCTAFFFPLLSSVVSIFATVVPGAFAAGVKRHDLIVETIPQALPEVDNELQSSASFTPETGEAGTRP
jgi:hypothetical protein